MAKSSAVRSFDLFDTLLGRVHCFSNSNFELVEKQFPFPGFTFYRMAAESKSDHTLPDIYRHLQQILDISGAESKALMEFEFETELNHIFPILENLNLVQDGDLIITDTYYSQAQIERILSKIGLKKKVRIYASPFGKSSGGIWDIVKKKHKIACHLGDSLHSDVEMAEIRKIKTAHYLNSQPTPVERALMDIGQVSLACLMRTLRLQNPYVPRSPEYLLWNEQSQLNVPLLIHASLYLDDFCKKKKKKRVLFTARDGCLWIQLFQKLFPEYESIYFHTSRFAYKFPTTTFIEYVRGIYSDESVIVDSNGRGDTCKDFFQEHLHICPLYLSIVNSSKRNHTILRKKVACAGIEKLNYDTVGALFDVRDGKPVRAEPEYNLRFVYPNHACIVKCRELLPQYTMGSFDRRIIDWAVSFAESNLVLAQYIEHAMYHSHILIENQLRHFHSYENGIFIETPGP